MEFISIFKYNFGLQHFWSSRDSTGEVVVERLLIVRF